MGRCLCAVLLAASAVAACASEPTPLYPGPALPTERVAILEETFGTEVIAIDRLRVRGGAWALLPGRHEIWVRAQVRGGAPNVLYKGWTYCQIALEAAPGRSYRSAVDKREKRWGALGKEVSMDIRIVGEDGRGLAYPGRCQGKRPRPEQLLGEDPG